MWTVPKEWQGESAYILAGGPSASALVLSKLAGKRTIVVNSSYEALPNADFLFFADLRWWHLHAGKPALKNFFGRIVTCSKSAEGPRLLKLRRVVPNADKGIGKLVPGLATDPREVCSQRTSLQGAMNLAFHLGAIRIVLLAADMKRAKDGRSQHHSPHPWQNKPGNRTWDIQMIQLRMIAEPLRARGVKVLNASLESRIDWWPKVPFEDTL